MISVQVVEPKIIEVMEEFTPENYQVVSNYFWAMVWSLPRDCLPFNVIHLFPSIGREVELEGPVHFFLVQSSPSEDDHLGFVTIQVHCEVGARRRYLSFLVYLSPLKGLEVEFP